MEKKVNVVITKGWNWAEIKCQNNFLELYSNNQELIKIPNEFISNVLLPSKNEVGIEFNLDEENENE